MRCLSGSPASFRHVWALGLVGAFLGVLPACEVTSGDEEPDPFCTIEPSEITVQAGATVRFTAECSHRVILDERMDANGSYITRVDFIDWFAPLVPGDFEAVVHPEGFPNVTAVAAVTVIEDPIPYPTDTIWRMRRGLWRPGFSPGGTLLGALDFDDGGFVIYDAETLDHVGGTERIGIWGFGFHPDDQTGVVINSYAGVVAFDWSAHEVTRTFVPLDGLDQSVYSPNGEYVAAWSDEAVWLDRVATDGATAVLALLDTIPPVWAWRAAIGLPELEEDELLTLPFSSPVTHAYFTADSSELVVHFGSGTDTVALVFIDVETGLESRTVIPGGEGCLNHEADGCPRALFVPHPDGERIIGYGHYSGTPVFMPRVFVASLADGRLEYVPDGGALGGEPAGLAVDPDGRYVVVASYFPGTGGRGLAMHDLERFEWPWVYDPTTSGGPGRLTPQLVAWHHPDRILANTTESGIDKQGVLLYIDPEDGSVIRTQVLPHGPVGRARWNPDGTRAYWFGDPAVNNIRLERGIDNVIVYDADGRVLWSELGTSADWVNSDPDRLITTMGNDLVWRNADTGEVERTTTLSTPVTSVAVNDEGTMVVGWNNGAGGNILQDLETGERLNALINGADLAPPYDWTPEGLIVDSRGHAWNTETRENSQLGAPWVGPGDVESDMIDWCFAGCTLGDSVCSGRCGAHTIPTCFAYSPSGNRVAIGEGTYGGGAASPEGPLLSQIRVLDVRTGVERGVFPIQNGIRAGCSLDWHPTRDELLLGSWDIVWNLDITTSLE